jgi:RHS repeat-associated protein
VTRLHDVCTSFLRLLTMASVLASGLPAKAQVTYTYTGQPYESCLNTYIPICSGLSIVGSFTVPEAFPPNLEAYQFAPTSFSFSDGADVSLGSGSSLTVQTFQVFTDADGNLTNWYVQLAEQATVGTCGSVNPNQCLQIYGCPACTQAADNSYYNNSDYSEWGYGYQHTSWGVWNCSPDCPGSAPNVAPNENPSQGNPSEPGVGDTCGCEADPINTFLGSFSETFNDLSVAGRGMPLRLNHTYSSVFAPTSGPLGFGWTHAYNMTLDQTAGGPVLISQENGSTVTFNPVSGGGYAAPPKVIATLVKNSNGTFTFTRRAQEFFTFSATGQLISEQDRNGYATTLSYDDSGRLSTVTDPAGRSLSFTYNGSQIASVTDPLGRTVQFTYDSLGNLATATDVNGGKTSFTYSSNSLLLTVTDPRGGVITNTYDSSNRVISQSDQLGRTTNFSYAFGVTTTTDPKGNVVQEQYNEFSQRTSLTRGYGTSSAATWTFTYDPNTLGITSITDPNGHVSKITYDASGNPLTSTDGLGRATTRTFDTMNDVTSVTDPLNVTTLLTYDAHGNLLTRSTPLTGTNQVQTCTYQYKDAYPGDVTAIVDPDGNTMTYTYDSNGNRITATDPLKHTTRFSYNGIGWLSSLTDARGKITKYAYNHFGDLTVTTDPLGNKVARAYDANRNLISTTDANGNVTRYSYDKAKERTKITRADGTILKTSYNADGTVANTINGLGKATSYAYDPLARLISTTDPLRHTTSYAYDGVGNQVTLTDPAAQVTTKSYDAANELVGVSYSDGKTPNVTLTYDADSQRISMTDGTGTSALAYDSLHRITAITNGAGAKVRYAYDLKSQLIKLTFASGKSVTRVYDAAGRLTSIDDSLGNRTTYGYDANNNMVAETLPGTTEIVATYSYDAADRLIDIVDTTGGTKLASFSYTRDRAGLLASATETGVPLSGTSNYGYNKLNQLAVVNAGSYSYDAADDVTGIILPSQITLNYDAANELTSLVAGGQTTNFAYDSRGNRLSRTPPSRKALTYAYDQANRMVGFGSNTTYTYNGDGLRMSKTVSGKQESFTWDASGSLPLLLEDAAKTTYIYGPDGLPLEQIAASGMVLFYLHDQLGSTRLVTNNSGVVQASYTYDPYGNLLASTGAVRNPFGYAGQYTDAESGLVYLRARYHDPSTAQFLVVDPARASVNPYSYAKNSPLNVIDPLGLNGLTFYGGGEFIFEPGVGYVGASGIYVHFGNDVPGGIDLGGYSSYGAQAGQNFGAALNLGFNVGDLSSSFEGTSVNAGGEFVGGYAVSGNSCGGGASISLGLAAGASAGISATTTNSWMDYMTNSMEPVLAPWGDYKTFEDPFLQWP